MMPNNLSLSGIPVILSQYLTETVTRVVARPWRERLCSWPWQPWIATRTITETVPSRTAVTLDGKILMHPDLYRSLENLQRVENLQRGPVQPWR